MPSFFQRLLFWRSEVACRIDNVLARGTEVSGEITFEHGLHVMGTVLGPITALRAGSVALIDREARVEGSLISDTVVLLGTVIGDVRCTHAILKQGANVDGTIMAASIQIEKGAMLRGTCQSHPLYSPFHQAIERTADDAFDATPDEPRVDELPAHRGLTVVN